MLLLSAGSRGPLRLLLWLRLGLGGAWCAKSSNWRCVGCTATSVLHLLHLLLERVNGVIRPDGYNGWRGKQCRRQYNTT